MNVAKQMTTCANCAIPLAMLPQDYTADAICRAMNLSGFIDPAWAGGEYPTLRMVLTPSFDPEVCVTISSQNDHALISIVVLAEQFWAKFPAAVIASSREEISVSAEKFGEWLKLFETASGSIEENGRSVTIDGMISECCLVSRRGVRQFKTQGSQPAVKPFLAEILGVTWNNCSRPRVRNGLSAAACYLDLKFPIQEVPEEPPTSLIAILGTPEGRKEFFAMLEQVKKAKSKR